MKKGIHITFSGLDGSGKTTCIEALSQYLNKNDSDEIYCMDGLKPSKYNVKLKTVSDRYQLNMFETFGSLTQISFALDLIYTYENSILPLLNENKIVITHRNVMCSKAYSMLRDKNDEATKMINRIVTCIPQADIHFYLSVPAALAYERVTMRCDLNNSCPSINENLYFLILLEKHYQYLLDNEFKNCIIIDGTKKLSVIMDEVIDVVHTYIDHLHQS